jgi:hypothetical protein
MATVIPHHRPIKRRWRLALRRTARWKAGAKDPTSMTTTNSGATMVGAPRATALALATRGARHGPRRAATDRTGRYGGLEVASYLETDGLMSIQHGTDQPDAQWRYIPNPTV